jgi:hypothetical protein
MTRSLPLVLVAGGLYEDIGPEEFWHRPGVTAALCTLGWSVHTPRRARRPRSWHDETATLLEAVTVAGGGDAVGLVAASHGCTPALRLALEHPALVAQVVLCWPATGDDPEIDRRALAHLAAAGVDDHLADALLDGELVRGLRPDELGSIDVPVALVPAEPEDAAHQRRTVAALRHALRRAVVGLGTPPSPSPSFGPHLGALAALLDVVFVG